MRYRVCVAETFSAAHSIRSHGGVGKYVHGHDFRVRVCATTSKLGAGNIAVDMKTLEEALEGIVRELDHRYLNEVLGVEDLSVEYLAAYMLERVRKSLAEVTSVEICSSEGRYCAEVTL